MLTQDRDEELVLFLEIRRLEKGHLPSHPCSYMYIYNCIIYVVGFLFSFCSVFLQGLIIVKVVRRRCPLNDTLSGELPPITFCTPRTRSPITIGNVCSSSLQIMISRILTIISAKKKIQRTQYISDQTFFFFFGSNSQTFLLN